MNGQNANDKNKQWEEDYDYRDQKKHGSRFSLSRLLLHVVFSPIIILIVAFLYFQDFRKAVLAMLMVLTAFQSLSLIFKIIKLSFAAVTLNIVGMLKNSLQIIFALLILGCYWVIYYLVWGTNFTF